MEAASGTVENDDLAFLLSLVARERAARNSSLWKTDTDAAVDEHGEACDAVWNELYRLLDGFPVEAAKPPRPETIKRALKRDMKKALKASLVNTVDQLVDDL